MSISTGYAIANLSSLRALTAAQRVDSYARLVASEAAWYIFNAANNAPEDNVNIISPSDNPATGRWIRCNHDSNCSGDIICTTGCSLGGKAYRFDAAVDMFLKVVPGFDISISSGVKSIQIHRWNQLPNTNLTGRTFLAELPNTGGVVFLPITNTFRWISIFAGNPSRGGGFDGVCFRISGNICTLVSF